MMVKDDRPVSTADLMKEQDERRIAQQDFHPGEDNRPSPLFAGDETEHLRQRWADVQTKFVDDPRGSVTEADELVATTIRRLTEIFADERNRLETEWGKNEQVSTEDLRVAFRRYRSFFDRLLSI